MSWATFPFPDRAYAYTPASLMEAWARLHAGDAEPFPEDALVVDAWLAFHAGAFEEAVEKGLAAGIEGGYAAANKAACVHAVYLERSVQKRRARLLEVAERCEEQQDFDPHNPAGYYLHACSLGRYAQDISIPSALAQGIAPRVRASLERTLELEPRHADAHIALGVFHAEVIDKVGGLVGKLTYGASRDAALNHFETALRLNPRSAIARVEYANALIMLDGAGCEETAMLLCHQAASIEPLDAMEKLDVERARKEIDE
jgi:tetratricopeptide (TPR) repeat protein